MSRIVRPVVLLTACLALTAQIAGRPAAAADGQAPVDAVHLRGAAWMLRTNTPIGNPATLAVVTDAATLLVDPNLLAAGEDLKAAVTALGGGPVRWVTATHHHGDHSEGFEVFATAVALVPDRQRPHLAHDSIVLGERPLAPAAVPSLSFAGTATIHLGDETVVLHTLPPGHTDGDLCAWLPAARVLAVGDYLFLDRFPIVDTAGGGSLDGYLGNLRWLLATFPSDTLVVPGHGTFPPEPPRAATMAELAHQLEMLERSIALVREHLAAGRTEDEIVAAGLPAEFAAFGATPRYVSTERWLRFVAAQLADSKP